MGKSEEFSFNKIVGVTGADIVFNNPDANGDYSCIAHKLVKERLASCWNACINLENPETDLPKLIEALKMTQIALHDSGKYPVTLARIDEALYLYKE